MSLEREIELYEGILEHYFSSSDKFKRERDIVERHFPGNIIVVGGKLIRVVSSFVYGDLYKEMHKDPDYELPLGDTDFMVRTSEGSLEERGWTIYITPFGDVRYINSEYENWFFDVMQFTNFHPFVRKKFRLREDEVENIKKFLSLTSLNVQSIAYNVETGKLMGRRGISAIKNRVVRINKYEEAKIEADRKGYKSVRELVAAKAVDLGYRPDFSYSSRRHA